MLYDHFIGFKLLDAAYIMHAIIFSMSAQLMVLSLYVNWKVNR